MWKVFKNILNSFEISDILREMKIGLKPATLRVNEKTGERVMMASIRNNLDSYNISDKTKNSVLGKVDDQLKKSEFVFDRISQRLRMYGYLPGMQFKPHIDGRESSLDGYENTYTVLIYLEKAISGGETVLYNIQTESCERINREAVSIPKVNVGDMLVFDRRYWHEGRAVIEGAKYVLRTDLQAIIG